MLPLLAEAAPDDFLDAVEQGLGEPSPVLLEIFEDAESRSSFSSSSAHTYLLWALETVSWSAAYLGRAARALARLVEIDPGGQLANRPLASLRLVFLPLDPQTAAPGPSRLIVLDSLREEFPAAAWSLLLTLLPTHHTTWMPTHAPRWRSWKPDEERNRLLADVVVDVDAIARRLTDDAGRDLARWAELVTRFPDFSATARTEALEHLQSVELSSQDGGHAIWLALNDLVLKHSRFYCRLGDAV